MTTANAELDPWLLAKERFLADLGPKDQELFRSATLENLYYSTSNFDRDDSEKSKARLAAKKLGPLLSAIESYGKALDTFTNIAPLYLAPIWGCIRVVLVMARTHGRFYDKIVETLGRIGDIMPRFRDYERIYKREKHQRLTQALSNAYLDIISLCAQFRKAITEQKGSTFRRILKPLSLDREFEEAIERFRYHKQKVEEEARTCHMIEAAEERDTQLVLRAAERRSRLLSRLSKVNCKYRHRAMVEKRHEGTGLWLQVSDEFRDWNTNSGSAALCCYGIPGCGKSVLASSIIDHLKSRHRTLFYYCDYADKRTLEPANVFGTLTREALTGVELIPETLANEIEQADHNGERILDHRTTLDFFKRSIEISSAQPLYLVLDGLDEVSENSQKLICHGLREVFHTSSLPIKLLITGREELGSLLRLDQAIPFMRVPISAESIALDISTYVRASTRRQIDEGLLVLHDLDLEEVIVEALVNGAQGMFLWVEFQLQELSEQESDHDIKMILQNLPRSLSETYDRLLAKIDGAERRKLIDRMFKWIVAARQPLSVDELREGIAFTLEDRIWDPEKIPTDFNRLVRFCGNLVVVNKQTQIVQLAHYTVQQYLLQEGECRFHFTIEQANNVVGETCVAYLQFANLEPQIVKFKENANTNLVDLNRVAGNRQLLSPDTPGQSVVRVWNALRPAHSKLGEIDMTKIVQRPKAKFDMATFNLLNYVTKHWLWHTIDFKAKDVLEVALGDAPRRSRDALFTNLVLWKDHLFEFRPWDKLNDSNIESSKTSCMSLLAWALMANHPYLIAMGSVEEVPPALLILDAFRWFLASEPKYPLSEENEFGRNKRPGILSRKPSKGPLYELDGSKVCEAPSMRGKVVTRWMLDKLGGYSNDSSVSGSPGLVYSRLLYACRKGHLDAIQACRLESRSFLERQLLEHLFSEAANAGQIAIMEYIYNMHSISGELLTEAEDGSYNALDRAILGEHFEIAHFLRKRNIDRLGNLYKDSQSYFDLVDSAIAGGKVELLSLLLVLREPLVLSQESGSTMFLSSISRQTEALIFAIVKERSDMVELMVQHGARVDAMDKLGCTPLHWAISLGDYSAAHCLVKHGSATVSNKDGYRKGVLSYHGSREGLEYVCLTPTPLYLACFHGHYDIVKMLLEAGADPTILSPVISAKVEADKGPPVFYRYHSLLGFAGKATYLDHLPNLILPSTGISSWQYPMTGAIIGGHCEVAQLLSGFITSPPQIFLPSRMHQSAINDLREIFSEAKKLTGMYILRDTSRYCQLLVRDVLLNELAEELKNLTESEVYCFIGASANPTKILPEGISSLVWALSNAPSPELLKLVLQCTDARPQWLQDSLLVVLRDYFFKIGEHRITSILSNLDDNVFEVQNRGDNVDILAGKYLLQQALGELTTKAALLQGIYPNVPKSQDRLYGYVRCIFWIASAQWDLVGELDIDKYCMVLRLATKEEAKHPGLVAALVRVLINPQPGISAHYGFLFASITHDAPEMVVYLCDKRDIDIQIATQNGKTPLIHAIEFGVSETMVKTLLQRGAVYIATDHCSETALDKALEYQNIEVMKVLFWSLSFFRASKHVQNLRRALNTCVFIGRGDIWETLAQSWFKDAYLDNKYLVPYSVARAQYLLSLNSYHVLPRGEFVELE